jgi:hypothetical protein
MATWIGGVCPPRVSAPAWRFIYYTEFRYVTRSLLIHASGSPLIDFAKNKTPPVFLQHYGRSLLCFDETMRLSTQYLWGADT